MAVEAQLCPQCGAAITFDATQTQVVCAHCGTTVVKAAAGGQTTVEKEIAADKLVQQTVAREKRLRHHGQPATAKVVSAQPTDIFRPTVEGKAVLMAFALEVQPEGAPVFSAECHCLVGLTAVDKYQPGTLLDARYDPQDHTQVAVEGRHGVPSSNPEEQARQRQAKEQARRKAQQDQQAATSNAPAGGNALEASAPEGSAAWWQDLGQQTQPAAAAANARPWGGARGPLPVPVEFDGVTSLGAAAAVHLHEGLRLPHFGPPRPNALVVYHDGLAFHAGKDLHTWRWEEVGAIQSNVWFAGDKVIITEHEYTLIKSSGEKVILDDGLKDVELAVKPIKQAVFARLGPPLAKAYGAGEAVTFGPVTLQKPTGIQVDGKPIPWNTILDIKTERGRITVTTRDSKKHEARVSAIPNMELVAQLLGLAYNENAYY